VDNKVKGSIYYRPNVPNGKKILPNKEKIPLAPKEQLSDFKKEKLSISKKEIISAKDELLNSKNEKKIHYHHNILKVYIYQEKSIFS